MYKYVYPQVCPCTLLFFYGIQEPGEEGKKTSREMKLWDNKVERNAYEIWLESQLNGEREKGQTGEGVHHNKGESEDKLEIEKKKVYKNIKKSLTYLSM